MKTGLGLLKKIRILHSHYHLFGFWLRETLVNFELANHFIRNVDRESLYLILKRYGANLGENCFIEPGITFHNCKSYSNLTIGDNCYVGKNCFFDLRDKITIGNNVTISMQCILLTHQDMGKSTLVKIYNHTQSPLSIGDNVYIGAGVIILQGLKIDREVIIAAGSLVKNNANERTIIGGVPARLLKKLSNKC